MLLLPRWFLLFFFSAAAKKMVIPNCNVRRIPTKLKSFCYKRMLLTYYKYYEWIRMKFHLSILCEILPHAWHAISLFECIVVVHLFSWRRAKSTLHGFISFSMTKLEKRFANFLLTNKSLEPSGYVNCRQKSALQIWKHFNHFELGYCCCCMKNVKRWR